MASEEKDSTMSEETFDYVCTSCAKDNVIKEAHKYCIECKGYCCTFCVNMHQKFPALIEHSLLDISASLPTDLTPRLTSFPTERCSIHQGKIIDMYCGDHDVVGCCVCIAIDHRNCNDIHSVPDDIETISAEGDYEESCSYIETMTERLRESIKQTNDVYLKRLEDAKQNSLLVITEQRKETNIILDRLEENSRREVESCYNELKAKLLVANEQNETVLNKFVELGIKLKQAKRNRSQSFVCTKLVGSTVSKEQGCIEKVAAELDTFTGDTLMSYRVDQTLNAFLQNLQKLGTVQGNTHTEPYAVTQSCDIDIKVPNDTETCNSYGSCILDDTHLLITDHANKKLKRLSIAEMTVVDYIELPNNVFGVCCVSNNEVAVGCNTANVIQFVSVGKTMKPSRQIKLYHQCFHVAYMDNKLYVSDDGQSVYVHDMAGALLQTISKDRSGDRLFTFSVNIALCKSRDNIFVTDFTGSLVFLNKKGNHITTTDDSDIDGADGVSVDGRGNVFVAGRKSNKIVQLCYDGTKRGVIVNAENGIKDPTSLCFKYDDCKLFVTMLNSDKMKVFELQ